MLSRRQFLTSSAVGTVAAFCLTADPLGMPIGCQTYPVRDALGKDFPGTLKELAAIGYRTIEMCSPPGYEKSGYGPLVNMKTSEMRQIIHDAGLGAKAATSSFGN